jgi:hypothetical protein
MAHPVLPKIILMRLDFLSFTALAVFFTSTPAYSISTILHGSTVSLDHYFPAVGVDGYHLGTVEVHDGGGPVVDYAGDYEVNVEVGRILVDFNSARVWSSADFNGLQVSGIYAVIKHANVLTDIPGWDADRFSFDAHSLTVNWEGLTVSPENYLNIEVRGYLPKDESNPVPDGGGTLSSLGLGLACVAWVRRRIRR